MFDGDGFGLGLTVVALDEPAPVSSRGAGVRPAWWSEVLPPAVRSRAGQAMELGRLQAEKARLWAYEAALICRFAEGCPAREVRLLPSAATGDPDLPGVEVEPGVSEFFVDELAAALGTSITSASYSWLHAATLCRRLPGTWAALADGDLDVPRGRAIVAEAARSPEVEPGVLLAVEAAVLPRAPELTVTGLRAAVRAELIAHDAAFADRRRRWAERTADATVRPDPDAPGRADLVMGMSVEDAHACWAAADGLARAAKAAGDDRPIGVLRAQAVRDRILGPDTDADRPPVTATLTVIAPLDALESSTRGDPVRGQPTPAVHDTGDDGARDEAALPDAVLIRPGMGTDGTALRGTALDGVALADMAVSEVAGPPRDGRAVLTVRTGGGPSPGGDAAGRRSPIGEVNGQPITAGHLRSLLHRLDALCPGGLRAPTGGHLRIALTDPDGALRAVLTHPEVQTLARRGCPRHPPDVSCGCAVTDCPPDTDRYRPTPAQHRFTWTRDRRCRMPGCTTRAALADLDHVIPHAAGGPTSCANLCCLCRRHHRLKTHATGWTTHLDADGTYTVTTPSGTTRTSRPPGVQATGKRAKDAPAGPAPPAPVGHDAPPPF